MQSDDDRKYYLKREAQERQAAASAPRGPKSIHADLADRYSALAASKIMCATKTAVS